jgi:hypothetical protein
MTVFVVFYDEVYPGYGERGAEQRRIQGVYDSVEKAREQVRKLGKMQHISFADFDTYEVE